MKPVKLVLSAFGPYLNRTEIDFSKLGDNGIYLITGDTGVGKTTIFEALSFALYGETVSGNDRNATMLRNKSANDSLETYVEVDFIEKGNKYHIYRSPKYKISNSSEIKSKNKEDKEIKPKYHNNKFELQCISEGQIYTKEKDGTKKIEEIIGIEKSNFKKICMIAQGEFMDVICESTENRKKLLNDVFETGIYEILTDKLKTYRNDAEKRKDEVLQEIYAALKLISCDERSVYFNSINDIRTDPSYRISFAEDTDKITDLIEKVISEDEKKSYNLKDQLDKNKIKTDEINKKLNTAAIVLGYEKQLIENTERKNELEKNIIKLKDKYDKIRDNPESASKCEVEANIIKSVLNDYDRLDKLENEYQIAVNAEKESNIKLEQRNGEIKKLNNNIISENKRLSEFDGIEAKREAKNAEYENTVKTGKELRNLFDEYNKSIELKNIADNSEKEYKLSKQKYIEQNRLYENLHTAFLDDQAGILSQQLEDGKPCPVCGSKIHPFPAKQKQGAPSKEEVNKAKEYRNLLEEENEKKSIECEKDKAKAESMVSNVSKKAYDLFNENIEYQYLGIYIDKTLTKYRNLAKSLKKQYSDYSNMIKERDDIKKNIEDMRTNSDLIREEIVRLTGETKTQTEKANSAEKQKSELRKKLEFSSKDEAQNKINDLLNQAQNLKNEYDDTKATLEQQRRKIGEINANIELLNKQISDNEKFDINVLNEKKSELETENKLLYEERTNILTRLSNNKSAVKSIKTKKDSFRQAVEYYNNCKELSDTANGKIKFDTYVVASYFDRILIRANNRMYKMTDGRYKLIRSDSPDDKRKTFGLDINVVDNANGKMRSVNTLSGGEKFMAALSLSLGLSDEIQSASGGIHLETMFIDEGFGSLDDKSLTKAIQTLKEISTGDCLIGIISHVGRLKEMINKRITVTNENNITTAKVEI